MTAISAVQKGDTVTVAGEVVSGRVVRLRGRMSLAEVTVRGDDAAVIKATWFGRGFLAKSLEPGRRIILHGRAGEYKGLALQNPDYELLSGDSDDLLHTGRIVPLYRVTENLTQRVMRQWVRQALESAANGLDETLDESVLQCRGLPRIHEAIRAIHFPDSTEAAERARRRFAYEELLEMQRGVLRRQGDRGERGIAHMVDGAFLRAFRDSLPYGLTNGQIAAVDEVLGDMASLQPMYRLLQGDVGAGKTIVGLHALVAALDGGFQAVLMAPTEILAEQHFLTLERHLRPAGVSPILLTGNSADNRSTRRRIAEGDATLVVGTHALIQDATRFHNLGLVLIDEQQRFGVAQRARLAEKAETTPDVLYMTATPIPRTMAMLVYGGIALSTIADLPPGRTRIDTTYVPEAKLEGLYQYVLDQARAGFQTYVVCPLIEESQARNLRALTAHFDALTAGPLAGLRARLIHGRMPFTERAALMAEFAAGDADVLFATTVVEVGLDVPRATTILIEDAWQFGLTQLHQLRGRVGRGSHPSRCFLLGKPRTEEGKRRVEILCKTHSGFDLAEEDLRLRGPGELFGARQAGLTDLRAVNLLRDSDLLAAAREDALTYKMGTG